MWYVGKTKAFILNASELGGLNKSGSGFKFFTAKWKPLAFWVSRGYLHAKAIISIVFRKFYLMPLRLWIFK